MLAVSDPELRALAAGESIVAFVARGTLSEGDEIELTASGPRPAEELKPAYERWASVDAPGGLSAVVVSVSPAAMLDRRAGAARHILRQPGDGDLVLLRVFAGGGPVLSDEAFAARHRSIEGALRG